MDLDQFLAWYFSHNTILINSVIVAILVLIASTLFFSLRGGSSEGGVLASSSLDELEKTMRKILDSTPQRPATEVQMAASLISDDDEGASAPGARGAAAPAAVSRGPDPQTLAQIETLKSETSAKEKVIQDLQVKLDTISKSGNLSDADKARITALEKELSETRARLSEYEIIEDDIANLSIYKAENAQLKTEVEKLRRGKNVRVQDDPSAVPQVSDIVAEFAAIVGAEDNPVDPVGIGNATSEKVIGMGTPAVSPDVPIVKPEPLAAPAPLGAAESEALSVDPSKLIAEASSLPEAADVTDEEEGEGDQGQKLINEFESFIKNG